MKRSDRQLNELASVLDKDKPYLIEKTIGSMRKEEAFTGAIELLISFYDSCTDPHLRRVIESFFNDMKDEAGREELIAEIRKPWKADTIAMLVSSCWQSGLNYSQYYADFLKVFIEGDYSSSIESMTVIEEFAHDITPAARKEMLESLAKNASSLRDEKKALAREMIAILSR